METQQIKKIMNVADLLPIMNLPWSETQQVEVFVFPLRQKDSNITAQSMQGVLSQYADVNLIEAEKNAWQANIEEKYGDIRY